MSQQSCSACNDLREYAPEFVVNGVTDGVGEHLKQDEGLSGAEEHNDCEDLMDVNDCLIGNMQDVLDGYEVCDWKDFMGTFIGNLYETLKAMIYSTCGQWCAINYMYSGQTFHLGEETSGDAYIVAGKGVSFLLPHAGQVHLGDVSIDYLGGGMARGSGTYMFHKYDFTDADACGNFDNGSTMSVSASRKGNSYWGTTNDDSHEFVHGGELIAEFRIKKSAYPYIKGFLNGFGQETGTADYHARLLYFPSGTYAYGQHGWCNERTGVASADGMDNGHLVPEDWWYLQLRLTSATTFTLLLPGTRENYSPLYFFGMKINSDEIPC